MRKLSVFNHVSLDGYFVDGKGAMDWAHKSDPEWNAFVAGNARDAGGVLVFGRVTYELMASFWPSPLAQQLDPVVAAGMNAAEKLVFSRSMKKASWNNTRLIKRGLTQEITRLKAEPGNGLVVMGSGTIVAQLAAAGLVDTYQLVVNPLVLGRGRTLFEGVKKPIALELTGTRRFKNGNVVLSYAPGPLP
ncbi:MAG: dihydrofolate reductase family protein [Archangium sp.]|nr:dihydrofolate reductase family protein [Archangium sp.]